MDTSEGAARYFAGNHIKFDDKGRRVDAPLVIFQWQQGVPVTVYPQGPGSAKARWAMK
jgi:branched-chain amino acid transport system substrate-binding protein